MRPSTWPRPRWLLAFTALVLPLLAHAASVIQVDRQRTSHLSPTLTASAISSKGTLEHEHNVMSHVSISHTINSTSKALRPMPNGISRPGTFPGAVVFIAIFFGAAVGLWCLICGPWQVLLKATTEEDAACSCGGREGD
eukprot:gnl/TRDRNA2_/TRDRNA2_187310_c0_seq1.p1 gnl/TRDRNA2_/TRDRNA2_187310_c0~~gnl/TRDRNA2_/TRDRNA2_187310_c0_seq1.p1  ORF type:complete len:139 (-),score=19.86 gnl/TRDRNA2_/TRDRNA2_187310_c0_seq1:93-509(-)